MSTMLGLSKNPEAYEKKALQYDQRQKTAKAIKYREKAARLRANQLQKNGGAPLASNNGQILTPGATTSTTSSTTSTTAYNNTTSSRTDPAIYERNAVKWEGRNNYLKAQKNREKVWRMQNPQYASQTAPTFYQNNKFVGYNVPFTPAAGVATTGVAPIGGATSLNKGPIATTTIQNAPIVETHVRPTIVEQTTRAERIVEVQPIIHREIDAPQVRVIEQHVYETVPSSGPNTITRQAIVEETVKPRIIEEVQPVVHREVAAPFVERVEQHVTEHVVKPTVTTKEVINNGTAFVAAGGAPLQQQQTTTTTTTTNTTANTTGRRL